MPRSHAGHDRRHSARVRRTGPPTSARSSPAPGTGRARVAAYQKTSPTANRPTVTTTTSRPPSSPAAPKVKRACPVCTSMPIVPRARPISAAATPFAGDGPPRPASAASASTIRAAYSAGPKVSATSTSAGAAVISMAVAKVPATNDPMAAVASAAPARPRRVMRYPSRAVITLDASPGIRTRIDVVDPPYIAP